MTLKTRMVTIENKGRDNGKVFQITEMPIIKADRWATRAMLALISSGVDIGEVNPSDGMIAIASVAVKALAGVPEETALSLLDELMDCVRIVPTGGVARDIVIDSDISEISTLFTLRKEVIALHTDFLQQDSGSN